MIRTRRACYFNQNLQLFDPFPLNLQCIPCKFCIPFWWITSPENYSILLHITLAYVMILHIRSHHYFRKMVCFENNFEFDNKMKFSLDKRNHVPKSYIIVRTNIIILTYMCKIEGCICNAQIKLAQNLNTDRIIGHMIDQFCNKKTRISNWHKQSLKVT